MRPACCLFLGYVLDSKRRFLCQKEGKSYIFSLSAVIFLFLAAVSFTFSKTFVCSLTFRSYKSYYLSRLKIYLYPTDIPFGKGNLMILFYTSPGCASCRKARHWLQSNHIDYVEKNIFSNLLQDTEIRYLLSRCENGTEDIISTRSKAYELIRHRMDDLSIHQLTSFIQQNPSVLKRPILLSKNSMVVGFDDDEITAIVPSEQRKERMNLHTDCPSSILRTV